jgi:hypothetical protein
MEIARACRASGFETKTNSEALLVVPGEDIEDALRRALRESRALIVVLAPSGLSAWTLLEIGAAQALDMPIFAVTDDGAMTHLPRLPSGIKIYPFSRMDEIIGAVREAARQLTDRDRSLLAEIFAKTGAEVDDLSLDPQLLERIASRFAKRAGKAVPEGRLYSELLRMHAEDRLAGAHPVVRTK